jgi:hypothetical protein
MTRQVKRKDIIIFLVSLAELIELFGTAEGTVNDYQIVHSTKIGK